MRTIAIAVLCVALSGCASVNYIMKEYDGVPVKEVRMPDDTYRIFDKPAENKLMVTSSLGSAAGQGFVKGLTLGAAPTEPPKPLYEAAALQFLTESGRPGCRILNSYLLAQPQWEVKYDCAPAAPPTPPPVATRSNRRTSG
jgi:hypothetical protein